ncbi:MAG: hypothetical protein IKI37_09275 [Oscillospiraceae bacterium]|nr:hypothetical protein [Oscillospiraceae bacterium]
MNPLTLMHMKPLLEGFRDRHPKFLQFFGYASQNMGEGSLLEIRITSADGKKAVTNIRVSPEDVELIEKMQEIMK